MLFKPKMKPETVFTESIQLTVSMKAQVASTPCPSCQQKTLELVRTEKGSYTLLKKTGSFEVEVRCSNCNFHGISNSTGFQFMKVNSKGKARE